jgi:hypothetical protein
LRIEITLFKKKGFFKKVVDKSIYQFNREIATHLALESILATTIVGEKGRIDALGISIVK